MAAFHHIDAFKPHFENILHGAFARSLFYAVSGVCLSPATHQSVVIFNRNKKVSFIRVVGGDKHQPRRVIFFEHMQRRKISF